MGISEAGIRIARAAVFTALCVALSAGAHVFFSATPLPVLTVAAVAVAVFALAFPLTGRERRFGSIAALLVPLQLVLDTVFTTGQTTCYGTAATAGGAAAPVPRVSALSLLCAGGDVGTPLARFAAGAEPAAHPAGPWLLLAVHVAVALAAAGWLRGGEAALARLVRAAGAVTFRPLLLAVTGRPPLPGPRTAVRPRRAERRPGQVRALLLGHCVIRRGPPRAAVI
ncbi:hypothetical protein [Streptomyces sp. YIM 98790]|uniref:hypothetical protein n=1 Tax=Streptomyces sp. YIM 98790 TaxID=2689077 RepID=UPI0014076C75|nr:hypothetical protein [Streptomyces sp. YIM 98790]